MPQVAFFVGGAASGIGAVGILLAWDRNNRGPAAADDIVIDDVGLYSWLAPITGAQLVKLKTMAPIQIAEDNCPTLPDGAAGDFVGRFEITQGGTAMTAIANFTLDLFDGSTRTYSVAPEGQTLKFELADNSIMVAGVSLQDRLTLQAWEDPLEGLAGIMNSTLPAKEIWRSLMTPNQPLNVF